MAGILQFGKKCYIKFAFVRQMEHQKIDPRILVLFFSNKEFESITDNNTDLTAAL